MLTPSWEHIPNSRLFVIRTVCRVRPHISLVHKQLRLICLHSQTSMQTHSRSVQTNVRTHICTDLFLLSPPTQSPKVPYFCYVELNSLMLCTICDNPSYSVKKPCFLVLKAQQKNYSYLKVSSSVHYPLTDTDLMYQRPWNKLSDVDITLVRQKDSRPP